jgi:hypothetical protein
MITKLLVDGALKLVQVIRYGNKKSVARLYDPKGTIPEAVLFEIQENMFLDINTDKSYQLTSTGMIGI